MDKAKISTRRKTSLSRTRKSNLKENKIIKKHTEFSLNENANIAEYDPVANLLDVNKIGCRYHAMFNGK